MSQFTKIDGNLMQISVASAAEAWGLNSKGDIYKYNFGAGCSQDPWAPVSGKLAQISVGSPSNAWGVDSNSDVYRYAQKEGWVLELEHDKIPLPTGIAGAAWGVGGQVAAASDGTVCALIYVENVSDPAAPPEFFYLVYKWSSGSFKLISFPDQIEQIAVGSAENIYALSPSAAGGCIVLRYAGESTDSWKEISGKTRLVAISAAADAIWGLDAEGNIYRYPGNDTDPWEQITGTLAQISVGSATNVWGLDGPQGGTDHNIYTYIGNTKKPFEQITGSFEKVSVAADGTTWALTAAGEPYLYEAQSPSILGSYANYILNSDSEPLRDVQVSIKVKQKLIAKKTTAPAPASMEEPIGFSFQLNANSRTLKDGSSPKIVWQQYAIEVGTNISFSINNWTASELAEPPNKGNPLIDPETPPMPPPVSLPEPHTIPAEYTLTITLGNDENDNVRYVTFVVADNNGKTLGNPQPIDLIGLPLSTGEGTVTTADLAPIVAFELDIVGPDNGQHTEFSSGGGLITYSASTPLTALGAIPTKHAAGTNTTGETSNSIYGTLPSSQSKKLTQCFTVSF
jgi:hypothetical protein